MNDHWTWPRRDGKNIVNRTLMEAMLRRGEHVHSGDGQKCEGGDSGCSLFQLQLQEALECWGYG